MIDNLTDTQKELIGFCQRRGYGWAKFANSVEKQGWCSPRQEEVLLSMKRRIEYAEKEKPRQLRGRYSSNNYEPDISDLEAMRSGDYF